MPVPEFQEFHLPALREIAAGRAETPRGLVPFFVQHFKLTDEERTEMIPSQKKTRVLDRITWALVDLAKARLLIRPRRGYYQITTRGQEVLQDPPLRIDRAWLMRFDEFREWQERSNKRPQPPNNCNNKPIELSIEPVVEATPEEIVGKAMATLNAKLIDEVLEQVKEVEPLKFEQLVLDLMLKMGYGGSREGAGRLTQASNDGGVDGLINEDKLGLDVIYLQAKRYTENSIGRPKIQEFVGALAGRQANKGVFITTSAFSKGAEEYAKTVQQKIILIDGERLAELMIEHNLGVSIEQTFEIKRIDSDYFDADL